MPWFWPIFEVRAEFKKSFCSFFWRKCEQENWLLSMNFISSISFPNEPPISWTFLGHFCHNFWVGATAKQQQKQQQTHPNVMATMVKKCSRNVQLIRGSFGKEILSTYKIGTLVNDLIHIWTCKNDHKNIFNTEDLWVRILDALCSRK